MVALPLMEEMRVAAVGCDGEVWEVFNVPSAEDAVLSWMQGRLIEDGFYCIGVGWMTGLDAMHVLLSEDVRFVDVRVGVPMVVLVRGGVVRLVRVEDLSRAGRRVIQAMQVGGKIEYSDRLLRGSWRAWRRRVVRVLDVLAWSMILSLLVAEIIVQLFLAVSA